MRSNWWKALTVALLFYTVFAGFLLKVPRVAIVQESIRNQHFHVALWFALMFTLTAAVVYAVRYLRHGRLEDDDVAVELTNVGILFGLLGLVTGSVWARFTWGGWWPNDVKLNSAAIAMLIYLAYLVLRSSLPNDETRRARVSSVYGIFAYATLIPLLYVLPRLTDSLHPGNGGNPGFNTYDLDSNLRLVFYPAVLAWTGLGGWIASVRIRLRQVRRRLENRAVDLASAIIIS